MRPTPEPPTARATTFQLGDVAAVDLRERE